MNGSIGKAVALAIVVVFAGLAASANAQRVPLDTTPDPDELRNIFTIQIENDVFNRIGQSDRDYTNGEATKLVYDLLQAGTTVVRSVAEAIEATKRVT